ncbi:ribonuclease P protein component [Paraoerskovia marina]|uniref:Ribonuclease P protein component n=2 Tax=Paraoerskovia marina TaxID=545619 RepID=A0A1H1N5K6_9CELL|nr:ribonuclease P protein component [Paraoerskovia marina]
MLPASDDAGSIAVPTVGFVVSKQVGNAVERNLVKRRLRGAFRSHLEELPAGSTTVVRALPASAGADYSTLEADLDRCLRRTRTRGGSR